MSNSLPVRYAKLIRVPKSGYFLTCDPGKMMLGDSEFKIEKETQ